MGNRKEKAAKKKPTPAARLRKKINKEFRQVDEQLKNLKKIPVDENSFNYTFDIFFSKHTKEPMFSGDRLICPEIDREQVLNISSLPDLIAYFQRAIKPNEKGEQLLLMIPNRYEPPSRRVLWIEKDEENEILH